jgi:hypothetical protein
MRVLSSVAVLNAKTSTLWPRVYGPPQTRMGKHLLLVRVQVMELPAIKPPASAPVSRLLAEASLSVERSVPRAPPLVVVGVPVMGDALVLDEVVVRGVDGAGLVHAAAVASKRKRQKNREEAGVRGAHEEVVCVLDSDDDRREPELRRDAPVAVACAVVPGQDSLAGVVAMQVARRAEKRCLEQLEAAQNVLQVSRRANIYSNPCRQSYKCDILIEPFLRFGRDICRKI